MLPSETEHPACGTAAAQVSRRTAVIGAAAAFLTTGARGALRLPRHLFTLGVASGDPVAHGLVIWTRLAPLPLEHGGGMPAVTVPVRWEVAEDERFSNIARSGTAMADPRRAHAVHVDVAGLRPSRRYFYRFIAAGEVSPVGRTLTAPALGAAVDRLRICFGSCQKYEVGHFGAYRHMLRDDPDLILFLGDYIYEDAVKAGDEVVRPMLQPEPFDLAGYRIRYAAYKLDPLLQAAHQAAPWVMTWDDHEVANDYGGARDQNNSDPAAVLRRRAAAYQAYHEHQPLRAAARSGDRGMQLYRALDWGGLAQFQILDDRQYRGPPACQPPGLVAAHRQYRSLIDACPELADPQRTMLGARQERWLMRQLGESRARWNILAQQTLLRQQARIDPAHPERGDQFPADTWSGFPAARDRIFRRWAEARTPNPIALGGDIHAFAAADIGDPAHPDAPPIAAEFVGGSITSPLRDASFRGLAARNGIGFAEDRQRGYARLDLTATGGEVVFRGLDDSRIADTGASDMARFLLDPGRPGLHRA